MDQTAIATALDALGLVSRDGLADSLWRLALSLDEWAAKLGLSNLRGIETVVLRHVLDSLLLTRVVPQPEVLIDIGTGPGVPALPLALAWPETRVIAMDSRRKSNWFVERAGRDIPIPNAEHVCARAEAPETLERLGGVADLVCSRGLARPRLAVELSLPYLRQGGTVAVLTGPEVDVMPLEPGELVRVEAVPGTDWQRRILLATRTS
jgi:16S rRNA (guanine527-N7)-methyltransferase